MTSQKEATFLGIPYDWRWPNWKRVKERVWNENDPRLFTPKVFGWGYTINLYELLHHRKKLLVALLIILVIIFGFVFTNFK